MMISFGCVFCGSGKENPNMHICKKCVQWLLLLTTEQTITARDTALAKGYKDRVAAIEKLSGIKEKNGPSREGHSV